MEALVPQARNGGYMAEQKKSPSTEEVMVDRVLGWIRSLTEVGLALIALGVVLQVIFGATIPFLGLDMEDHFWTCPKTFQSQNQPLNGTIQWNH